jgi:hypothetical protein
MKNGTNNIDIISEENYKKKIYCIIINNRCLIKNIDNQNDDRISLDINFIIDHQNLLFRNMFGKDTEIIILNFEKIYPSK